MNGFGYQWYLHVDDIYIHTFDHGMGRERHVSDQESRSSSVSASGQTKVKQTKQVSLLILFHDPTSGACRAGANRLPGHLDKRKTSAVIPSRTSSASCVGSAPDGCGDDVWGWMIQTAGAAGVLSGW